METFSDGSRRTVTPSVNVNTYTVTFAFLRWQFMVASTPTTVPCITVPFFSSIVTCSRFSFCRNLTSFIVSVL